MPLIAANQLKKSFATRLLFEGVCFEIGERDKVGLVGVNGCGKTTLFHLITGKDTSDEGNIYISRGTRIGTMAQTVENTELTVYDATLTVFGELIDMERELGDITLRLTDMHGDTDKLIARQATLNERYEFMDGLTYRSRTRSMLLGLGFTEPELSKPLSDMSGGQRNKAQLARVLLSGANLLLLDEPTNHLDIGAIAWLEEFLCAYQGAFIVISHDRYFLDKVTGRTMELKNKHLTVSEGNYSRHMELISNEQEMLRRHYANTQKEIRRIEGIVEQQRRWGQEHNFITAAAKLKQAERLRATLVSPEKDTSAIRFKFRADKVSGNDVIIAKDLSKRFEKNVFRNASLHVRRGERVFLLGPNGCGKTTLLNILMGRLETDSGETVFGANVRAGYYEQTMEGLSAENTVLDEIWNEYPKLNTTQVRSALAAFLFGADDIDKKIAMLSGGEQARVQLLKLMLSGANLLLLDEPTNHLDIDSRDALENALEDYDGTMLIVTHDRYLVNRLADRILHMTENGITEYIGGYDDFIAACSAQQESQAKDKPQPVNDYKQARQLRSAINQAEGELRRSEELIATLESELADLNERMAAPDVAVDYEKAVEFAQMSQRMQAEIDTRYTEWAEAERLVNELKAQN